MLHGVAQGNLYDAGTELNTLRRNAKSTQENERVERWPATGKGVRHPSAGEAKLLDVLCDSYNLLDHWTFVAFVKAPRHDNDANLHACLSRLDGRRALVCRFCSSNLWLGNLQALRHV